MPSDPESSSFLEPSNSSVEEDILEDEGKDAEVIFGEKKPYEDEALADIEVDLDGLITAVMQTRNEREIAVNSWFV